MKKLTLSLCAAIAMASAAYAGETYTKESKSVAPPPCPQWYADNEFNLTLSGVYMWTGNNWEDDTYFRTDHGWGGAIDAKYFVHRYFGFGVQGWIAAVNSRDTFIDPAGNRFTSTDDEDSHAVGGLLGTFTLRFPISCSRWAPYLWIGGGGVFGGGQDHDYFLAGAVPIRHEFDDSRARAVGQVGGGFEVRLTPKIGWTNDVSWNVVSGSDNNFGMARTGINFAF